MACCDRPAVLGRRRLQPEVYKTVDGKVIVEDELLNFLAVKIKTLSQDEIVLLATSSFDSEWIESSKNVLFDVCNTKQRNVTHKGLHKDANNIKCCLKVLNECGDNTPRFVSHYLDELPAVSFSNIDVSSLLSKMMNMQAEVSSLKTSLELQAELIGELTSITADVSRRVCAPEAAKERNSTLDSPAVPVCVEDPLSPHNRLGGTTTVVESVALPGPERMDVARMDVEPCRGGLEPDDQVIRPTSLESVIPRVEERTAYVTDGATVAGRARPESVCSPGGPEAEMWSTVAKRGAQRLRNVNPGTNRPTAVVGRRRRQSNMRPIVGTGDVSDIRIVKTKRVSVFATRFTKDLDSVTLSTYLRGKLGREVECQKFVSEHGRFASFKVTAECDKVDEMYATDLWPEGAHVRRFFEPRRAGAGGRNTPAVHGRRRSASAPGTQQAY